MDIRHIVIDGIDIQITTISGDDEPFGNLTDGTAPHKIGA